jgi:cobalamin synthase
MIKNHCQAIARSKWSLPLFSVGLGGVVLLASWLGGQLGTGVFGLAALAGFGLVLLLLGGRNETIRGLTVGRDERFAQIDLRATAVAGLALITTVIVAWLVEIARGHSGNPYGWLAAIGGLTYILAVALFRWRG